MLHCKYVILIKITNCVSYYFPFYWIHWCRLYFKIYHFLLLDAHESWRQQTHHTDRKNIETFQMDPIYEIKKKKKQKKNCQFAHYLLLDIHMLQMLTD